MTAQAEDREDAITDAALERLAVWGARQVRLYFECEGCDLLVHHTDLTTHARECEPLRALAAGVVDG